MTPDTSDIARRLRQTRANMLGTPDEDHYWDCHAAADEIERLRRWGRLTDAEREAVAVAAVACASCHGFAGDPRNPAVYNGSEVAATLRGLLERMT